jgi:peptidoglycan/LPS O-acetylase OafA/YrhL
VWGIAILLWKTGIAIVPYLVALSYSTLVVAALPWPLLAHWGRWGDFSYGMYLFAFPVQQTIVHFAGPALPLAANVGLSFGITLVLAILSWHLVERPALELKSVVPRS